jgi:hypothetical protein
MLPVGSKYNLHNRDILICTYHWRITLLWYSCLTFWVGGYQMICYGEFFRFVSRSQDRMLQQIGNADGLFFLQAKVTQFYCYLLVSEFLSINLCFIFFCNELEASYCMRYSFFFLILTSSFHGGCRGLWLRSHNGGTHLDEGLARRRDLYLKKVTLIKRHLYSGGITTLSGRRPQP